MSENLSHQSRIPDFQTREEEAEWWDTHDLADYLDELTPVEVYVSPNVLSECSMSVRLPEAMLDRLRSRARRKGVGHTTLARMWIMERLDEEERYEAKSGM